MLRRAPTRRGRGVLGTMATTAVVAGTAPATSRAVAGRMDAEEASAADDAALQSQAQMQHLKQELAEAQSQAPPAPAPTPRPARRGDMIAKLERLGRLKTTGVLTDDEFAAAKAKLLAN